jgi:hypothetical protein
VVVVTPVVTAQPVAPVFNTSLVTPAPVTSSVVVQPRVNLLPVTLFSAPAVISVPQPTTPGPTSAVPAAVPLVATPLASNSASAAVVAGTAQLSVAQLALTGGATHQLVIVGLVTMAIGGAMVGGGRRRRHASSRAGA